MPVLAYPCKVCSKIAFATGSRVNACTLFNGMAPNTSLGVETGNGVSVGSAVAVAKGRGVSVSDEVAATVGAIVCDLQDTVMNKTVAMMRVLIFMCVCDGLPLIV